MHYKRAGIPLPFTINKAPRELEEFVIVFRRQQVKNMELKQTLEIICNLIFNTKKEGNEKTKT